jgi:hypothetical protein
LTDSIDTISFIGKLPQTNLPSGIIESTNDKLVLPILTGLFILEEKVRKFLENSG